MKTALLILASATLGGAIVYTLVGRSPAPKPASPDISDRQDRASMAKDIDALRREVALLAQRESARSPRADERQSASVRGDRRVRLDARELAEGERRHREGEDAEAARRVRTRLEERLAAERREPQWATDTEQQIEAVVGQAKAGAALNEVKCASTVCKVVVKLDDEAKRQALAFALSTKEPFSGGTYYAYDGPLATLYVARKGHDLPGDVD